MRKLLFTLLILIFTAGVAFAENNVKIKGNFSLRGSRITNEALAHTDAPEYDYYDQDMNINATFFASKTTWAYIEVALVDEEWGTGRHLDNAHDDENIAIERAWMTHVFPTKTKLDLGLMNGGTWATTFGDNEEGRYRIKVTQPVSPTVILLGVIEKGGDDKLGKANSAEQGQTNPTVKDAEKDDNDRYAVGAILTFGDFHVKPLYYMVKDSSSSLDRGSDGTEINLMALGVDGKFGMFGFEAEYMNWDIEYDPTAGGHSYGLTGMYVNFWANLAPAKVGLIYADGGTDTSTYGGASSEWGFDFGDDFDLTLFLSDWVSWGPGPKLSGGGLTGMNAIQVYGSYKFTDKMSVNASYTMIESNWEAGTYKDAEANEMDFGFAYKITKYMTYSIAAGFASIDYASPTLDPDDGARLYHKIKISF